MDQELVVRVQQGDQAAFETLIVADYPRLFRVANGILGDRHLAEDATQQAFLDIWRDIRRLKDPAKFEGWSYRLMVHVCYVEVKRKPDSLLGSRVVTVDALRTADAFSVIDDREQLDRGFRQLSMDHRVVLVLHYLLGMTPEQVAETLGISRWTVYSRLDRAVKAMRTALEADARPNPTAQVPQEAVR
jgi:RNA polymerase sigma-70 factor (ECF subfamily)